VIPRLPLPPDAAGDDLLVLRGDELRYLRNVLRLGPGDAVLVFDDTGREWPATLERLDAREAGLRLGAVRQRAAEAAERVFLLLGLTKGDAPDRVVRGATEVGVAGFLPAITARSIRRLPPERAVTRRARWQKIAAEAVRQSGRTRMPRVALPCSLTEALASDTVAGAARRLFFSPAAGASLAQALPTDTPSVVLAIGPEGGFTDEEERQLAAAGFAAVNLGPRVLRAVTAGVVVPALVLHHLGEPGSCFVGDDAGAPSLVDQKK